MLVVVKYVVKGILPHFRGTFKSGDWGKLGENGGVHNILGSRTNLVLRLPNQAPYQLGHTRIYIKLSFLILIDSRKEVKGKNCRERHSQQEQTQNLRRKGAERNPPPCSLQNLLPNQITQIISHIVRQSCLPQSGYHSFRFKPAAF